ncbi:MAG TPA: hypothetical protein VFI37_17360 [Gaiellaceae bacterium]|nr:hypothetical protein [Gaiellaceae bacterium]
MVDVLLAFGSFLLALRLAGAIASRRRASHLAWAASLLCYAAASAALAWGAAAGWSSPGFRVYYLCGGLLTAPLLGTGSLLLSGRRWAGPVALVWVGLAAGIVLAMPLHGTFAGASIPEAQAHVAFFPARLAAILGNSLGTLAVVWVALASLPFRPRGNALILAGVGVAAAGSAVAGLGVARTALFFAVAVVLLYAGFAAPSAKHGPQRQRRREDQDHDHGERQEDAVQQVHGRLVVTSAGDQAGQVG